MSSVYQTILGRRTIRRFRQRKIPYKTLKKLVNAAHLAPSAANLQPLEYLIINCSKYLNTIFPYLRWANYIAPYGTPPPEKRPTAYIAILVNPAPLEKIFLTGPVRKDGFSNGVNKNKELLKYTPYDVGAAVENIILTAWEEGIGVCWIKAMNKEKLESLLGLPEYLRLDSILAIGYRAEKPRLEILKKSVKYWKDSKGVLHVPKRKLSDILYHNIIRHHG